MLVQDEVDTRQAVLVEIRLSMLNELDGLLSPDARALDEIVSNTEDISALWNLRSELTNLITAEHGAEAARTRVNLITEMFGKY
jgi:hypothetical protein